MNTKRLNEICAKAAEILDGDDPDATWVIHTVRACVEDGKWAFTGDAVTEDRVFGGRDAVGSDDLGLPVEATSGQVREAVTAWVEAKEGMRLATRLSFTVCS